MKFHLALLGVLCVHALAQDEKNEALEATATSIRSSWNDILKSENERLLENRMTRTLTFIPDASAVVLKKTPQNQSTGASLLSSCSSYIDEINVGVQGIVAKNGVEYVYLPLTADNQAACFESYNNTVLEASDLVSCCDAAAKGGYNSFRFDGGGCTGFKAWLSPMYTQSAGSGLVSPGLFVAKQKLSNFTSTAPTFNASSYLSLARMFAVVVITDDCPFSKILKVTTYSKTDTLQLDSLIDGEYRKNFYEPELCNDSASTDKRTVTFSVLDSEGSQLASIEEVVSSDLIGRHPISHGGCVLYNATLQQKELDAIKYCQGLQSKLPFASGYLPYADLLQEVAGLSVRVDNFWIGMTYSSQVNTYVWTVTGHIIVRSLFNAIPPASRPLSETGAIVNVTDGLLYWVNNVDLHYTLCMDFPYFY